MTGVLLPLLLAVLQGPPPAPRISVQADRPTLQVGDTLTYVIRASSRSAEPLRFSMQKPRGFDVVSNEEQSEVGFQGAETRSAFLKFRMVARTAGKWTIGPASVEQGGRVARAQPTVIEVIKRAMTPPPPLSARARAILERAPPPSQGNVTVNVLIARNRVMVGEQVDVVTAAWFPRELRLKLRRAPTLQPPALDGLWSYAQPTPVGIAASRVVDGVWYDLFALPQIAFPIKPGPIEIGSATLTYSVPAGAQFFGQEERYTLSSTPVKLTVLPVPAAGQPPGYAGATGDNLSLDRDSLPVAPRAGEPFALSWSVSGTGNVALWPKPTINWPAGVRAYPDRVNESFRVVDGRVTGRKTFKFIVVTDSVGLLALPTVVYPYFDLDRSEYRESTVPGVALAIEERARGGPRGAPLLLATDNGPPISLRISEALGPVGWLLVLLLPPIGTLAFGWWRRRMGARLNQAPPPPAPDVALDLELRRVLNRRDLPEGRELALALELQGVPAELAGRAAELRAGLLALRYAVSEEPAGAARLRGEAADLAGALAGRSRRRGLRPGALVAGMAMGALAASSSAQSGPEQLYRAGAYAAAATELREQAVKLGNHPAAWYNAGAAAWAAGDSADAVSAWLAAERLAPRDLDVRDALARVPAPDAVSDRRRGAAPVTAAELGLLAGVLWVGAWGAIAARRRRPALVMGGAAAFAVVGAALAWRSTHAELAVVRSTVPLRVSPHGMAPGVATLNAGAVALIRQEQGGWYDVVAPSGATGWLPASVLSIAGR